MADLSQRLANLPPEKRALLLAKLQAQRSSAAGDSAEKPRFVLPPAGENCRLVVGQPGNVDSLALEPVARRAPAPGEVEIAVESVGLNFRDVMIVLGMHPVPSPLGNECAGRVVAVGEGVTSVAVGDDVLAMTPMAFSPYVYADARSVLRRPAGLDAQQASSIAFVYTTAYLSLVQAARLRKGERVLVHSAAGGVGLAAIQIARWIGAEVFATAGTPEKRAYIQQLGVAHVMDSRTLDFAREVLDRTQGEGVDVVLNSLAGEAIPRGLETLRVLGRFVEIGKRDIYQNSTIGLLPFRKALSFIAVDLGQLDTAAVGALLKETIAHFDRGDFKPLPVRAFPLAEVVDAFKFIIQAKHIGKVVVTLDRSTPT